MAKKTKIDRAIDKAAAIEGTTILDKYLIKRYLEKRDSGVYKLFKNLENNFITKLLEYELIGGMTTGNFQKRVGKALNEDPLEYTKWSIFFGLLISLVKYGYHYITGEVPYINVTSDPVKWWGHILFWSNFYRYGYVKLLKQPISAPYIWPLSAYIYVKNIVLKKTKGGIK